jgi:nucleotide-binding universal stress UspA family protein
MNAVVIPIARPLVVKKILVATDFSPLATTAARIAAVLARQYGSELFLAHVTPVLSSSTAAARISNPLREAEQRTQASLQMLLSAAAFRGLRASPLVGSGNAAAAILEFVNTENIDLVTVATRGKLGVSHLLMGSVAEEILRSARCPVLTVSPSLKDHFQSLKTLRRILVPTDLSASSRKVLPPVCSLAAEYNASVELLHILPTVTGTNLDAEQLTAPLRAQMEEMARAALTPRCCAEFAIGYGDTVETILLTARNRDFDLIAMGVHRGGFLTTHIQNTAYKVIASAPCPVLTWMAD